jgi:hypothetical protein
MGSPPDSQYACWADYDNDGDPDYLVGSYPGRLYRNDGGQFINVTSRLSSDPGWYGAWGDYDNDQDLDLFTLTGLYENRGDGSFTHHTSLGSPAGGYGTWVDLDNDGTLELYSGDHTANRRRVYRYESAFKRFKEVSLGSLTLDPMANAGIAWADYDNNGFMDLVVASGTRNVANRLYRNQGNHHQWLHVKPVGTRSNRSGIGVRVYAEATIAGKSVRQMRELNGTPMDSTLRAHFGLGDATNVAVLRLEWPSGTVQEFRDVAARQMLTIVEPSLEGALGGDGRFHLSVRGDPEAMYEVQASEDLVNWTTVIYVVGPGVEGSELVEPGPAARQRFYRLK